MAPGLGLGFRKNSNLTLATCELIEVIRFELLDPKPQSAYNLPRTSFPTPENRIAKTNPEITLPIYVCVYVYTHVYTSLTIHLFPQRTIKCVYIYTYTYIYISIYVYYIHIYIYIFSNEHSRAPNQAKHDKLKYRSCTFVKLIRLPLY